MSPGPRGRVSRRRFVLGAGAAVLLGGCSGGSGRQEPADDVATLARALALEHELIAAYAALPAARPRLMREIAAQEREHAESVARAIRALGGRPARAPSARGAARGDALSSLREALALEDRAVALYAAAVAGLAAPELRATAAAILASEAGHAALLRDALGREPVPAAFAPLAGDAAA